MVGNCGTGELNWINPFGRWGFIDVDGGGQLYFHTKNLDCDSLVQPLRIGDRVEFVVGVGERGVFAEKLTVVYQPPDGIPSIAGEISSIEENYMGGVIRTEDGRKFQFHRTELKSLRHMSSLLPGMPVRFVPKEGKNGLLALSIEQVYTTVLDDALKNGARVEGRLQALDRSKGRVYANTCGGLVLLSSQDFSDPIDWTLAKKGDAVTFIVDVNEHKQFIGYEVRMQLESNI